MAQWQFVGWALFSLEWLLSFCFINAVQPWAYKSYGFCLKEGKFTVSLLVPQSRESTGNPSGKVLTCLLFLFLGLSRREASLQTDRQAAERERESWLGCLCSSCPSPSRSRDKEQSLVYQPDRGYSIAAFKKIAFPPPSPSSSSPTPIKIPS